jgi:hypothetical protein
LLPNGKKLKVGRLTLPASNLATGILASPAIALLFPAAPLNQQLVLVAAKAAQIWNGILQRNAFFSGTSPCPDTETGRMTPCERSASFPDGLREIGFDP